MSPLKSPVHVSQIALGYCLPACAQMALAQLGIAVSQEQLAQTLGTRVGIGTTFSRVERLQQWPVEIQVRKWGGVERMETSLAGDIAVIAAVTTTSGLPGWGDIRTQHTVLVINMSADYVIYHDPSLDQGPVSTPRDEFLLAWSEMSELAAFLSHR
jgi:ABC-type bacteriocin/lantibiotic exporter with double-glycine peptidase domain